MPQSLAKNLIHLIFSTKNRHRWLDAPVRSDLHRYMAGILQKELSPALIINSVSDQSISCSTCIAPGRYRM